MNEEFRVLTVRDLDFLDDSKKPVKGMQLWLIRETDEKPWNGWEVLKVWIPDGSKCESVVVALTHDDFIRITWDRRGKPVNIELLNK